MAHAAAKGVVAREALHYLPHPRCAGGAAHKRGKGRGLSPSDPAAQWTGAMRGPAFFAYSDNYLIDLKCGVIVDAEASRAIRQAEVGTAKTMIDRTEERFGLKPKRLAADSAYGSAPTLDWLVNDKKIEPHIPVIDMERRKDGTFSRDDFTYDKARDVYTCPAGKLLTTTGRIRYDDMRPYRASRALPKFESYGMPVTAAFRGRKAQDAIEWFHGIGRLASPTDLRRGPPEDCSG